MSNIVSGGAVLGTVRYGEAYLGRPLSLTDTPLPTFSVQPLEAVAYNYTSIQVTWSRPTSGTTLRLVRNSFGASADEEDGLVILVQDAQDPPLFVDLALSPDQRGQFLYYTVWNQAVANGPWWRAGDTQTILPVSWGYGSKLKSLLPGYLFDMDDTLVNK